MQQLFVKQKLAFLGLFFASILCLELLLKEYRIEQVGDVLFTPYNLRIGAIYIALNIIYFLWLRNIIIKLKEAEPSRSSNYKFIEILGLSSPFLLLAFLSYPNTKTDIYNYLHSGLMILSGANPYLIPAGDFASPVSSYFVWNQTSTYGPISQLFFLISALFAKTHVTLSVYVFKLFCLLFHILNGFLIWKQLNNVALKSEIVLAYLVNPILLFEQVSQVHLDVFLCTSLILLIGSIRLQHLLISIVLVWIGVLTKTLPIIWMPLVFMYIFSVKKWKTLLLSILVSIAIMAVVSFAFLGSVDGWASLANPGVSGRADRSLHLFLISLFENFPNVLPAALSGKYAYRVYLLSKWASYLAYIACYALLLFSVYLNAKKSRHSEHHLILCIGWSTLLLFLFATPWNPSWYVTILIPITFLLLPIQDSKTQVFVNASLIFCFSSSTYYLLTLAGSPSFSLMIDSLITFLPTSVYLFLQRRSLWSPASSLPETLRQ